MLSSEHKSFSTNQQNNFIKQSEESNPHQAILSEINNQSPANFGSSSQNFSSPHNISKTNDQQIQTSEKSKKESMKYDQYAQIDMKPSSSDFQCQNVLLKDSDLEMLKTQLRTEVETEFDLKLQ